MAWSMCGPLCPECGHCDSQVMPWDDRHAVMTCERCHHQRLDQVVGDDRAPVQERSSSIEMPWPTPMHIVAKA
jgi:hypothetical protein